MLYGLFGITFHISWYWEMLLSPPPCPWQLFYINSVSSSCSASCYSLNFTSFSGSLPRLSWNTSLQYQSVTKFKAKWTLICLAGPQDFMTLLHWVWRVCVWEREKVLQAWVQIHVAAERHPQLLLLRTVIHILFFKCFNFLSATL